MKKSSIIVFLLLSYSAIPTVYFRAKNRYKLRRLKGKKEICLTFDDGPHYIYTNKLLDLLKKYNIKATFFVVAKYAEKNPKIIKRMKDEGHTIGLHSLEHKNYLVKGFPYTNKDFKESNIIMKKLKVPVKYFRAPWGCVNLVTIKNIIKSNYELVFWNTMVGDWRRNNTSRNISKRLIKKTNKRSKGKSLVCLHDGRGRKKAPLKTIGALEEVIPKWIKNGYKFISINELNI